MLFLLYPLFLLSFFSVAASENKTIRDTFSFSVKYCESYILGTSNAIDSEMLQGSIIPKQGLFSSTYYLTSSRYQSNFLKGAFLIEPLDLNLCGTEVKEGHQFYISFKNKELFKNHYLSIDQDGNYFLTEMQNPIESRSRFLFSFSPVSSYHSVKKPSYHLIQNTQSKIQFMRCDLPHWCSANIHSHQAFFIRILPVVAPSHEKAIILNAKLWSEMQKYFYFDQGNDQSFWNSDFFEDE